MKGCPDSHPHAGVEPLLRAIGDVPETPLGERLDRSVPWLLGYRERHAEPHLA